MNASIADAQVQDTLARLYADAQNADSALHGGPARPQATALSPLEHFTALKTFYLPVNREFGNLLYALARTSRAKTVVEFGTSFGISTIFLAAAVRDNGGGKVVTTEFLPEKADRARKNIAAAGLEAYVDFRVGDALETLRGPLPGGEIDLVLLDGAKELYLPVLKILESRLRSGALVASDNTNMEGTRPVLEYLRNPANGYLSSPVGTLPTDSVPRHEISVRV